MAEFNLREVGAIWNKTAKSGKQYMWGTLKDGRQITILSNNQKNGNAKAPDWKIYVDDSKPAYVPPTKTPTATEHVREEKRQNQFNEQFAASHNPEQDKTGWAQPPTAEQPPLWASEQLPF